VYDVFILGLMIVGITSLVVFSYKIFHSRVYPVGIVRETPAAKEYENTTTLLADFGTALEPDTADIYSYIEIARGEQDEQGIKDYRDTWKVYSKRRLGPQSGRRQYKITLRPNLRQNPSHEREESPLEEEVKLHSKQFEDFEKRLRRLEIESVQKKQEATEEKPQPPQPVVH
jgi:hypothetical protein